MIVSQKQRVIYPFRPQCSYGSENVNKFESVWLIFGLVLLPIWSRSARYCSAILADNRNVYEPISWQYLPNIGQYCRRVAMPMLEQYCAQCWANIVQHVLPISVQYLWPTLAQYRLPAGLLILL